MSYKITRNEGHTTINCQGKLIDLSTPKIMGIINTTPDSFYADSRTSSEKATLYKVESMCKNGATFIDIGGMSSRPGASLINSDEEISRVLPTLKAIRKEFPEVVISIDTIYSKTANKTINEGANIINDISGGSIDSEMIPTVANLDCPYILMHMLGTPLTMKSKTTYNDLLSEISQYFISKITDCNNAGIKDIILDIGFGFSKTIQQNFELLAKLDTFQCLGLPILTGISRKSTIWKTLDISSKEALNGTTALHMAALQNGSKILRVHDVKEAHECITLFNELEKYA